jgi:hypothetical protein
MTHASPNAFTDFWSSKHQNGPYYSSRQQYKGSRNGQESYKFLTLSKRKSRASAFVLPVMSNWAPSQEMNWHIRGPSHEYGGGVTEGQGCFGLETDSSLPVYPALTMDTETTGATLTAVQNEKVILNNLLIILSRVTVNKN